MKSGFQPIFLAVKISTVLLVVALVFALVYGGSFLRGVMTAKANTAFFYSGQCLGGWSNVDKVTGQPDVARGDSSYTDENSASVKNSNAQIFCSGFEGDIPLTAKHEKVTLHFSWYIADSESHEDNQHTPNTPEEPSLEVVEDKEPVSEEVPEEITPDVPVVEIEPEPEEMPVIEEPTAFNPFGFFSIAHAQEGAEVVVAEEPTEETVPEVEEAVDVISEEPVIESEAPTEEVTTEPSPASGENENTSDVPQDRTEIIRNTSPDGAYFEALYTLDGQEWYSLGYISRIANDIEIEIPVDLFATIEDLKKVQIALHTVERFDSVPEIFLDALWLEVSYVDEGGEGLVPPGSRDGDIIFSETVYGNETAVVVLRNVALDTLSNVLTAAATTSASTTESIASSTASSTPQLETIVASSTLSEVITMTGVEIELWLYASTTQSWSRVADDSLMSRNPQVEFIAGNIFWIDKNDAGVWRYNPRSGGYDSLSFSENKSLFSFYDESGDVREREFTVTTDVETTETAEPDIVSDF
jgi:hypothetical protein